MRRKRVRIAVGLGVAAAAAAVALTAISFASAGDDRSLTSVAARATARFHDFDKAKAAGWDVLVKDKNNIACIDNQPVGGMGVHYANASILFDGTIDAEQPEALVYAPNAAGQLKLAALEYIVFASAWKGADKPELFGQQFALTPDGNRFGIPAFWSLHVWIWQPNPTGLMQPWNPRVHC
jgi:hypothetical protein